MKHKTKYYTTGQFAKLCHTTKDTLFHYDSIGLLVPKIIKENGYRLYDHNQYYDYDLIKVLQEANMSLKEIKAFMVQRHLYIPILKEKNKELEKEKKRIDAMQYRIQQAISLNEFGITKPHGIVFEEYCDEEHLMTIHLPHRILEEEEVTYYISQHLQYCNENHLSEEIPTGSIIKKEYFSKNDYIEDYYYVRIMNPIDLKNYYLKESGNYVCIIHEGYYDTIYQSLDKLYQYIKEHEYDIKSDCFEFEINNYFQISHVNEYLILLSVRVS